jgi:Fe-S oxidoreductase
MIGNFGKLTALASAAPGVYNFLVSNPLTSGVFKRLTGFAPKRSLPSLYKYTLRAWMRRRKDVPAPGGRRRVYLFVDEFTNYNDTAIGIKTVLLLEGLGYSVVFPDHGESGRAYMSKGLLRTAKKIAEENVRVLKDLVTDENPMIGVEPSAILSFRDEYPDLVDPSMRADARRLAKNAVLLEEFLSTEIEAGRVRPEQFTSEEKTIKLHGHCQQKALTSLALTQRMLSLPRNYTVRILPTGCCGMAGSFGYEKEHYELSMKVGELVLFPALRKADPAELVAAPGTSCRHQIKDGLHRGSQHPAEILYDALLRG